MKKGCNIYSGSCKKTSFAMQTMSPKGTKQKQNQRFVLRKKSEGEQGRRTKTQDKQQTKS